MRAAKAIPKVFATPPGMTVLCVMAAKSVALATVQAVKAAQSWGAGGLYLPAARDGYDL